MHIFLITLLSFTLAFPIPTLSSNIFEGFKSVIGRASPAREIEIIHVPDVSPHSIPLETPGSSHVTPQTNGQPHDQLPETTGPIPLTEPIHDQSTLPHVDSVPSQSLQGSFEENPALSGGSTPFRGSRQRKIHPKQVVAAVAGLGIGGLLVASAIGPDQ